MFSRSGPARMCGSLNRNTKPTSAVPSSSTLLQVPSSSGAVSSQLTRSRHCEQLTLRNYHVAPGLPGAFSFRGQGFATGSDERWAGPRVKAVSSSPRGGRDPQACPARAERCRGNSLVTQIWNPTRPWEKWRNRESKTRRCHRGPGDLGQGRARGRGAARSRAAGDGRAGVRRLGAFVARRVPGSSRDARGSRQGASGGSVFGRPWARRRAAGPLAETWTDRNWREAQVSHVVRTLGVPQPVHRVGRSRLGPTFWLKLRPASACATGIVSQVKAGTDALDSAGDTNPPAHVGAVSGDIFILLREL